MECLEFNACKDKNARMVRWLSKHCSSAIEQLFISTCTIVRWHMKHCSLEHEEHFNYMMCQFERK